MISEVTEQVGVENPKKVSLSGIPQFIRYLFAGGLTYISEIVLTYILITILGLTVLWGGLMAWAFALIFSYFLNIKIVFLGQENGKKNFALFIASTAIVGFILNSLLFPFLVNSIGMDIILGKTIVIALITVINYLVRTLLIFKN